MAYAIKAAVVDPRARTFTFAAHKTMYGGKLIAEGDPVFVFASENEGGQGLIARGIVTHSKAFRKKRGIATFHISCFSLGAPSSFGCGSHDAHV